MRIALVDDLQADRIALEQLLQEYDSIHQIGFSFSHFASGEALLTAYQPYKFAVIFLDVYMDGISGTEAAQRIRAVDDDVALVFLTVSEVHRPDAFSVFATTYLNKPCSSEQVFRTMDHILRFRTDHKAYFSFSFDRKDYSLPYSEIVSLNSDGNYIIIVDRHGKSYRTRMTFSVAEDHLDSRFLTLIKGVSVNMDCIVQFSDRSCILQSGAEFPIQVKRKKDLQQKWLNYKFTKIRQANTALGGTTNA